MTDLEKQIENLRIDFSINKHLYDARFKEFTDNLFSLQKQVDDLKNTFQLQINYQAFQIIELQKMIADDKKAQHILNGHATECIENYGKELDLILQRIVVLWETVMKPKPT